MATKQDMEIGMQIRMLDNALRRRAESSPALKVVPNLTMLNCWIILYLEESNEKDLRVCQHHLEEEFGITRSAVSRSLKLMEQKGLIERQPVPGDARLKRIVLTQKSKEITDALRKNTRETEKTLRRGLSEEEIETLHDLLGRLLKNVENPES